MIDRLSLKESLLNADYNLASQKLSDFIDTESFDDEPESEQDFYFSLYGLVAVVLAHAEEKITLKTDKLDLVLGDMNTLINMLDTKNAC